MVSIFIWKNERKEVHVLTVKELEVSLGLRSLFYCGKKRLGVVGARVYEVWVVGRLDCD